MARTSNWHNVFVHIYEKWFNDDVDGRSYLLLPDEEPPQRRRRSKRHMPKTMFLAANVMICILQSKGDNEYKLPHMGKQKLRREG
ncbi:Mar9 Transposase [Phytophthora megakarya]|uniref:Mar9 Transposase n=1 Tax=Phytophthora megakarya TaxID=4795 RepID=A0A225UY22_9STRA|nr:Mar9 Transposase [Phytophthora megakarya]